MTLSEYGINFLEQDDICSFVKCDEKDGTSYHNVRPFFNMLGISFRKTKFFDNALSHNGIVIVGYNTSKRGSHVAILKGYDPKRYAYVLDDPWFGKDIIIPEYMFDKCINSFYLIG